jgi:hypothetical protein
VKSKYYETRYAHFYIFILLFLSPQIFSSVFYLFLLLWFFLYKTVRKIGGVNISVFLFVNVKRRTEDSELVLNIVVFAVVKLLHYRSHTKWTCTWKQSIPVLLSCYVTRFVSARTVIVFPRDNTARIWCITSEAPPVRIERDREDPHLVSLLPVLISLRASVSMVTDDLLLFSPIFHFVL